MGDPGLEPGTSSLSGARGYRPMRVGWVPFPTTRDRTSGDTGRAMSQENVELVLASYEWFNRERRFARDWWHADGEYVNSREDPDHATYRGVEEIDKLVVSWFEAYPDLEVQPVEVRANGDRVFLWLRFSGHGAESGAPLDMELAQVVTIEDVKVRRCEEYLDRVEALEAVGLRE
jgi:ketosteroid isomerase-like protein